MTDTDAFDDYHALLVTLSTLDERTRTTVQEMAAAAARGQADLTSRQDTESRRLDTALREARTRYRTVAERVRATDLPAIPLDCRPAAPDGDSLGAARQRFSRAVAALTSALDALDAAMSADANRRRSADAAAAEALRQRREALSRPAPPPPAPAPATPSPPPAGRPRLLVPLLLGSAALLALLALGVVLL